MKWAALFIWLGLAFLDEAGFVYSIIRPGTPWYLWGGFLVAGVAFSLAAVFQVKANWRR
jgi:hypothetical protein